MAKERQCEDAESWQRRIDAWQSSGLSLTDFVNREALARSTFLRWRKLLGAKVRRRRSRQVACVPALAPSPSVVTQSKGGVATTVTFVEVTPSAQSRRPIEYGVPFEVGLRSGRRLQVPAAFDPDVLERLIAILEVR